MRDLRKFTSCIDKDRKWAAGLPVAGHLFDFDIQPWGPRENRKLEIVESLKHDWDIVNPYDRHQVNALVGLLGKSSAY